MAWHYLKKFADKNVIEIWDGDKLVAIYSAIQK